MTTRSRRRSAALATVLTAASLTLAACAEDPVPQPTPAAEEAAPAPALGIDAAESVLTDLAATVERADAEKSPELLDPRVMEPAMTLRTGQYLVDERTEGRIPTPAISTEPQAIYVPRAESFPRVMMAVTAEPEGANLPQLLAFQHGGARDPYRLWGWAELYPGVTVPAMPSPQVGAVVLPPDAGGLVASPQDALARYVATLADPGGEDAAAFTPRENDPFKEQYRHLEDELGPTLRAAGTVEASADAGPSEPVALETADGGALVMGEVRIGEKIARTEAGSQLALGGDYEAYLEGNGTVTGSVNFRYTGMVILAVPAADAADQTIQVLGASRTLIASSRDDGANPDG